MTPSSYIKTVQVVELSPTQYILMLEDDLDWVERHSFKTKEGAIAFAQGRYSVDKNMIRYYPCDAKRQADKQTQ